MQQTNKVSETVNRGLTAVAMTIAIATLYTAMVSEGQIGRSPLRQQIQTVWQRQSPELPMVQETQESLATVVSSAVSRRIYR